ncbi:hypothetical protein R50072_12080 [Simiduia litorea]|uniref:hypothetical protein n=1 Tax=Simiduia litorea TaxID=1435348 RepID=UPI0036F1F4A7
MNFNKSNQPVKSLVLHYANELHCDIATSIVTSKENLNSKEDAEKLAHFFWEMIDQAVEDESNNKVVEGIEDLQSWLEKTLYIFTGYFKKQGYEQEWSKGHDKYHAQ